MRVMVDTNVLLSSLVFFSGNATGVILSACSGDNVLLLSTFCIDEACAVMERKWSSHTPDDRLRRLPFETVRTPPDPRPGLFKIRAPIRLPRAALRGNRHADVFVTSDKDFEDVHVDRLHILTSSQYMSVFRRP